MSQFSVAFEQMEVMGRSCGGRVEAVYTPNGFLTPGPTPFVLVS